MVLPLIPIAIGALMASGVIGNLMSGAGNLYAQGQNKDAQRQSRDFFREQGQAYNNLNQGYAKFLDRQGRSMNPDRQWTSYYGQARKQGLNEYHAEKGINAQTGAQIATAGGMLGGVSSSLLSLGKTYKWF